MKKASQPKSRLQSFLEGLAYLIGRPAPLPKFPEVKPPEKMVLEAWENTGRHLYGQMKRASEEHQLTP